MPLSVLSCIKPASRLTIFPSAESSKEAIRQWGYRRVRANIYMPARDGPVRSLRNLAGWMVPATILALLPKCGIRPDFGRQSALLPVPRKASSLWTLVGALAIPSSIAHRPDRTADQRRKLRAIPPGALVA